MKILPIQIYYPLTVILILMTTWSMAQEPSRINNSQIAFTMTEKDLLPESIAYSAKDQSFYVGSTRKGTITKIDRSGTPSTFVESGQFDHWMVIGIKIDEARNVLWFCSSGGENLLGYAQTHNTKGRPAGVFKVDLQTGELLSKYTLEQPEEIHFFNDLVIGRNGDVYVTHMFDKPAIYKIANGSKQLELFASAETIAYPNGITIADNQATLFVAHSEGLASLDIPSKRITDIEAPEGTSLARQASIDGLYYRSWSLIGVQPDLKAVRRFHLNDEGDKIDRVTTFELKHPMMDNPTTGVLIEDAFYYIANSQFGKVKSDGTLPPLHEMYEPVILKIDLP